MTKPAQPIKPYKGRDAGQVIDHAIALYEDGIEIEEAAKEIGVPARTIHRWLATNASERWKEVQQARAMSDYEAARKRRNAARDTLEGLKAQLEAEGVEKASDKDWRLAHAREVLRAADTELDHQKWLLERLLRKLYGHQDPGNVGSAIQINIGIRRDEPLDVVVEQPKGDISSANE